MNTINATNTNTTSATKRVRKTTKKPMVLVEPTMEDLQALTLPADLGFVGPEIDPILLAERQKMIQAEAERQEAVRVLESHKKKAAASAKAALKALDKSEKATVALHWAMVALVDHCSYIPKKEIRNLSEWAAIFGHKMPGLDRTCLVEWVHKHTPIRILFHSNGHFDRVGWSDAHVKAQTEAGLPVWNVADARLESWWTVAPERIRPAFKLPSTEAAIKAAARELAKVAYDLGSIEEALDLFKKELEENGRSLIAEAQKSKKFEEWTDGLDEARQKERDRVALEVQKAKEAERAERAAKAAEKAKAKELMA